MLLRQYSTCQVRPRRKIEPRPGRFFLVVVVVASTSFIAAPYAIL
jgi:hypothetical protein